MLRFAQSAFNFVRFLWNAFTYFKFPASIFFPPPVLPFDYVLPRVQFWQTLLGGTAAPIASCNVLQLEKRIYYVVLQYDASL